LQSNMENIVITFRIMKIKVYQLFPNVHPYLAFHEMSKTTVHIMRGSILCLVRGRYMAVCAVFVVVSSLSAACVLDKVVDVVVDEVGIMVVGRAVDMVIGRVVGEVVAMVVLVTSAILTIVADVNF